VSTLGYGPPDVPSGGRPAGPQGDVGDTSVGDLVSSVTGDLSRLMRAELALAKAEAKEEATRAGRGAGLVAGAGIGATLVLTFASLAVMFGLGAWMRLGWAALIIAAVWAVVAAVLWSSGRHALQAVNPGLPETAETLKEDAQWVKKPRG
jgi:Putative Actinobacterial Holin-X, holin superfamily III